MNEQQGWYPDGTGVSPATGGTTFTIEYGDGVNTAARADSASVRLTDTGELPFLQPSPSNLAVENGPDWIDRVYSLGRRPATIAVAIIITGLIFAAFVTQTDRDEPSPRDGASAAGLGDGVGGSDVEAEQSADGVVDDVDVLKSSAAQGGVGAVDSLARSSGVAFVVGDERLLTVVVGEPEEASATPTPTTAPPSTAAPITSEPPTITEATTTTVATTTTTEPTTTVEPTTTTDDVVSEVDDVWVKALLPGSTDGANAPAFRPGDIFLQADGSEDIAAFRFRIYVKDEDEWKRAESSSWRRRREFDTRFRRYNGRTIRWTVEGRTEDDTRLPPTPPLYIHVDSDRDADD